MPTRTIARCSIYKDRPKVCRDYPTAYHYTPDVCTFKFDSDGNRSGSCGCDEGACCITPREGGEPGGNPLPEAAGGEPCMHLEWEDVEEKTASDIEIAEDTRFSIQPLLNEVNHES